MDRSRSRRDFRKAEAGVWCARRFKKWRVAVVAISERLRRRRRFFWSMNGLAVAVVAISERLRRTCRSRASSFPESRSRRDFRKAEAVQTTMNWYWYLLVAVVAISERLRRGTPELPGVSGCPVAVVAISERLRRALEGDRAMLSDGRSRRDFRKAEAGV